jgi:TetR/AcrR family transcriptional regulator, regulator of autoinduction and epiphytic fitness
MAAVKSSPPTRAERARQTRTRMLDRANELFISQGYAATTMEQIALAAGVAAQTLYYTFGTKGQLLCEVMEAAAAGVPDPPPAADRPWVREMLEATSPTRMLALAVEHGTNLYERVAPLWPAINAAAASDPRVESYWTTVAENRRGGVAMMVQRINDLGALKRGLDSDRATDLVMVLFGHDVFRGLVLDAGWGVADYKAWLFTTLTHQLLRQPRVGTSAYADLSYAALLAR